MSKELVTAYEADPADDKAVQSKETKPRPWWVVYVKSDSSASLEPLEVIQKQPKDRVPLLKGDITRHLLKSEQAVKVPVSLRGSTQPSHQHSRSLSNIQNTRTTLEKDEDFYLSTLVFNRVSKHMWLKRVKGDVGWAVYEDPLV